MDTTPVGRSGLRVSDIGLGTLEWGGRVDARTAGELLERYLDLGGSLVELPSAVSPAAEILGSLLPDTGADSQPILCARSGVRMAADGPVADASRGTLLGQLDAVLATLGRSAVDLWVIDVWDASVPLDETLSAMETAWRSGRVRYLGLSHYAAWQIAAVAGQLPVTAVLAEHSLVHRAAEPDLLQVCDHYGIGVIAGAALGRGVLTGKYASGVPQGSRGADAALSRYVSQRLGEREKRVVQGVLRAAHGLNLTPVQIALAWSAAKPGISSRLVAPRNVAQLEEVMTAELPELPEEILQALDEVSGESRSI
ncbi:aldo/keto reductase [Sediminivirga luteola]|uniref:Oxidoreductase n=1 Tax=Sediminivirga luteola TaxID=1774748 RepID=A0A8J2XEJ8_9MICO|nr:aldo/keto reductase [Sediminivirga luteola]GGA08673.1 oxidoreductase [Sediminivirga luteola]